MQPRNSHIILCFLVDRKINHQRFIPSAAYIQQSPIHDPYFNSTLIYMNYSQPLHPLPQKKKPIPHSQLDLPCFHQNIHALILHHQYEFFYSNLLNVCNPIRVSLHHLSIGPHSLTPHCSLLLVLFSTKRVRSSQHLRVVCILIHPYFQQRRPC